MYQGEQVLLIDEFDSKDWDLNLMKKVLDKWPLQLSCRYLNKCARWTIVFIISNDSPDTFYTNLGTSTISPANRDALERRYSRVTQVLTQDQAVELVPPSSIASSESSADWDDGSYASSCSCTPDYLCSSCLELLQWQSRSFPPLARLHRL